MRFKDFILNEEKEKHAVLAFGRMNPPTTGHQVLVNKVHDIAKKNNASHHVVLSGTQDKSKNPLSSSLSLQKNTQIF
jgi:nicotinamide mononucleotide adenylyltransferase